MTGLTDKEREKIDELSKRAWAMKREKDLPLPEVMLWSTLHSQCLEILSGKAEPGIFKLMAVTMAELEVVRASRQ